MKEDFYLRSRSSHYDTSNFKPEIKSDFYLIFSLLKELLFFILLFIPYLFAAIYFMLFGNSYKSKEYFSKIFTEPFKILSKITQWFFEAKYTASLILFLYFAFFFQLLFLQNYMTYLMVYPTHFFTGNYYSVLTSIFLHADIIHISSNCLALLVFGRIVEKQFDYKIIFVFLASGIIANIVSNSILLLFYSNDLYYSLGASGAIAGLIIFAIMIEPFAFTSVFLVPLPIFLVGWCIIILDIIGLTNSSNINHFAHLGGYSALIFLFFFLEFKHRDKIIAGFLINLSLLALFFLIWKILGINLSSLNIFS